MKTQEATVEIPVSVLASLDTLDELEDWLTRNHPRVLRELRQARKEDLDGKFKPWRPRHVQWPTKSK
jgi:predicted ribonuclease YlaK